jgi:hypothetical protein
MFGGQVVNVIMSLVVVDALELGKGCRMEGYDCVG